VKHILTVLIALLFLALQACEGPAGPAGAQGPAGTNGANGVDAGFVYFEGFKDSLKCASCHTPDGDTLYYVASRVTQWEASKHNHGGDFDRNTGTCAGCHTTEGFMERAMKGFPVAFDGVSTKTYANSSAPGCFACHSPHKDGSFEVRGDNAPVVIKSNVKGQDDVTFDYGKGNLCVLCHQTRSVATTIQPDESKTLGTDSITINTTRWYSHYGVQGQMIVGKGGFHFAGTTVPANSFHTNSTTIKSEGCVVCHMAEPTGGGTGKAGGHTMNIKYDSHGSTASLTTGCTVSGCHPSTGFSVDYKGVQTEIHHKLDSLRGLLETKGWLVSDVNSSNYGLVKLTGGKLTIPMQKAGALWNFFFVEHDLSEGVHNTAYAKYLLDESIKQVQ
jgi:hypothetical protein